MDETLQRIGIFLKEKRLGRGFSLELVSERTNISPMTIKKMEDGESIPFLAEVHLKGFMKNLCEVYEVDPSEILALYAQRNLTSKAMMETSNELEEEAKTLPSEEIPPSEAKEFNQFQMMKGNFSFKKLLFPLKGYPISLFIAFVLIFGFVIFFFHSHSKKEELPQVSNEIKETYKMNSIEASFDLKIMDTVRIFFNSNYYLFTFRDYRNKTIFFTVDTFSYQLDEDQTANIDMNGDGINDLLVNFKKGNGDLVYIYFKLLDERAIDYDKIWETGQKVLVGYEYTLLSYKEKVPISVYIKATKLSSYISYIVDGSRQGNLTLSPGKDMTILADETLEISIGNYRSVHMVVNEIPLNLTLDHDKFSLTKVIKWIKDPNNETKSNLVIKDYVEKSS